jgi:hypothetical protein
MPGLWIAHVDVQPCVELRDDGLPR